MARKRVTSTKYEIIQVATEFFLEKGVSETSPKMIAEELGLSTGNITYYFPTKDHLLSELVEMLCAFQHHLIEKEAGDSLASVTAVCLELAVMAALCEDDPIAKDFYIASYLGERCLEVIQRNDAKRAMRIFGAYKPDWTDADFAGAQTIVSGVEYATLRTTSFSPALETRISGALEAILTTYGVPEDTRKQNIQKVLAMNYRQIAKRVFIEFKDYVAQTTVQALEAILPNRYRRSTEGMEPKQRRKTL